jgi:acyl-CoA thioester hydrolase
MKLAVPEEKTLIHSMTVPIRWGDMDAMGHVNNTIYFRYMEIGRLQWMMEADVPANPQGEGPVIVNAFCNFIKQLEFPGEVLLHTYVGDVGRSSFDTYHVLARADDPNTVYANGGATVVWVNLPLQKSAPLPSHLLELLGR